PLDATLGTSHRDTPVWKGLALCVRGLRCDDPYPLTLAATQRARPAHAQEATGSPRVSAGSLLDFNDSPAQPKPRPCVGRGHTEPQGTPAGGESQGCRGKPRGRALTRRAAACTLPTAARLRGVMAEPFAVSIDVDERFHQRGSPFPCL